MANAYVTEFRITVDDRKGRTLDAPLYDARTKTHLVTYTTSSVQSPTLQRGTHFIRIVADADTNFEIDTNPTAIADQSALLPASTIDYIGILPDGTQKIAFIQTT